jgi:hypothetical protein
MVTPAWARVKGENVADILAVLGRSELAVGVALEPGTAVIIALTAGGAELRAALAAREGSAAADAAVVAWGWL